MSSFNFSDITLAGAYAQATKTAQQSDNRNAERHPRPSEPPRRPGFFASLTGHLRTAITEMRAATYRLASRQL